MSLQIKKIGSEYSFSWRADDGDAWSLVCKQTADENVFTPTFVGLVFKTWNPLTTLEETFEFDYFTTEEPPEKAPVIEEVLPDPVPAFADTPLRIPMSLEEGFPLPTWSLATGPAGAEIDPDTGVLQWTPATDDVDQTVSFTVEAQNAVGTGTESFDVLVKPSSFLDEFDGTELAPIWEWHEPLAGALGELSGVGYFELTILDYATAGNTYDTWAGFDRMPKLRLPYTPTDDFAIETQMEMIDPPGTPAYYHVGLWVQFDNPDTLVDGLMWGYYSRVGWADSNTINVERIGNWTPRGVDTPIADPAAIFRIERRGDEYRFLYRLSDADPWTLHHTMGPPDLPAGLPVSHVGLFSKNWNTQAGEVVADFEYFSLERIPPAPPTLELPCDLGDPDTAWVGMPYVRPLELGGNPFPDLNVLSGPSEITYDRTAHAIGGWTPDAAGPVAIQLEASNEAGTETVGWNVEVADASPDHDDEFDEDPADDLDYWELYTPEPGVAFSLEDLDGSTWWRMEVPALSDNGQNFDHWTAFDRAVQLRHMLGDGMEDPGDFLIETRLRIDQETAPPAGDEFHVGLMVYFGQFDIMYWGPMQRRNIGGMYWNINLERSGTQNMVGGYDIRLLRGATIGLRIERKCDTFNFFYMNPERDDAWNYAGSVQTPDIPQFVGLVMKTWGNGLDHSIIIDFNYFDIVEAGEGPIGPIFVRGDVDGSGVITIGDAIALLNHMFGDAAAPACPDAADIDDSGNFTIGDAIALLNFMFADGAPPSDPGPSICGPDPTDDDTLAACRYDEAKCP